MSANQIRTIEGLKSKANRLQQKASRKNAIDFAQSGKNGLGILGEEWDKKPDYLVCGNAVIDLNTGLGVQADPTDFLMRRTKTDWKGLQEKCPEWENFIDKVFLSKQAFIRYVQKLLGLSLYGGVLEHLFAIFCGEGSNGKTTLMEVLICVLGDYCCPISGELVLKQSGRRSAAAPSPEIMALRGRRLVYMSETEEGRAGDPSKIKLLTGGDRLSGRHPYGKRILDFDPTHLLVLLTNHLPEMDASDYGIWRRLIVIPFDAAFVPALDPTKGNEFLVDLRIKEKLLEEKSGILAWLVRGLHLYLQEGLDLPAELEELKKNYHDREDQLTRFVAEKCTIDPLYEISGSNLHKAYKEWALENCENVMSTKRFGTRMKLRFKCVKSSRMLYKGIALKLDI